MIIRYINTKYDIISAKENQATPEAAFGFQALINEQTVCEADKERRRSEFASVEAEQKSPSDAGGGIWFSSA